MTSASQKRNGVPPRTARAFAARRARAASARQAGFVALGIVSSQAPKPALMAALARLRPQCEVHLRRLPSISARRPRYRVEARLAADDAATGAWLSIKSALMAAFPADKPNAVTALDP